MKSAIFLSFLMAVVSAVPAPDRPINNLPEDTPPRVPLPPGGESKSFPGPDSDDGRGPPPPQFGDACECSTQNNICAGNTAGLKNITCDSGNKYIQCSAAVCSVQTCPEKRVWNETTKVCTECPAVGGFHISADRQFCACDEGTTYDFTARKCVACPVNATILPDECFCPRDQPLSASKDSCLPCPADITKAEEFGCECTNASLFWSNADRTCKPCPGEWKTQSGAPRSSGENGAGGAGLLCQCPGTNDIFDRQSVSCFTCPASSVAVKAIRKELPDFCRCLVTGQFFDEESRVCECREGQEVDKARNMCVATDVPTSQ